MLILTRKLGESVQIGDGVTVSVLGIKGGHVKLGITAPPETQVLRDELARGIKEINLKASRVAGDDLARLASSWDKGMLKVEGTGED